MHFFLSPPNDAGLTAGSSGPAIGADDELILAIRELVGAGIHCIVNPTGAFGVSGRGAIYTASQLFDEMRFHSFRSKVR